MKFEKFRLQNGLMASVASIKDGVPSGLQCEFPLGHSQLFSMVTVRFRNDVIQLIYYTPWNPETLRNCLSNKLADYAHNAVFMVFNGRELGRRDPQWKILLKAVETGLSPKICALLCGGKSHE